MVLAAGKKLYQRVGAHEFSRQAHLEGGFWVGFAEILSTHPTQAKRVRAVMERGAAQSRAVPVAAYALK